MIRAFQKYFANIPSVFLDGFLYATIAFFTATNAMFGADDAAKFIKPLALFWIKGTCAVGGAVFLSIKMFRSTAFADHQEQKRKDTETAFFTKASTQQTTSVMPKD